METVTTVPIRTVLLDAFKMFRVKAIKINDLKVLTKFPVAYIYLNKIYVAKEWIKLYIVYEYVISAEYVSNILDKMVDNMKIMDLQELSIATEKKQYLNLNQNPPEINWEELRELFKDKSDIK